MSTLIVDQIITNSTSQTSEESAAGVTPADYSYPPGNVKRYGAVGDGTTDDTTAIENAWSVVQPDAFASLSGEVAGQLNSVLYFPPGDYNYSGTGLTTVNGNIQVQADPSTVRIRIPDGVHFITATGNIANTEISGINFYGGAGAIRYTFTGNNVTGRHVITDCMFSDYTVCAVGNDSEDFPHIKVQRCTFRARAGENAFGVALGGFADQVLISDNDFRRNKVHVKIGDRLSGNWYIKNNDFINISGNDRTADIWIVPNSTDAGGSASGQGAIINQNKFGNENMATDDYRILVALEDTTGSPNRLEAQPDLTWNTTAFVTGVTINENSINGVGSQTAAFIQSYVQHCRGWVFHDNEVQGGDYTYLVEFAGDIEEYDDASWDIRYSINSNPNVRNMPISNKPIGFAFDPFVQSGDQVGAFRSFPSLGDDTSFADLLTNKTISGWSNTGSTDAGITDSLGGTNAVEVTASSATGRMTSPVLSAMTVGAIGFAEIDLKKSTTDPVDYVDVFSLNFTTSNNHFVRTIKLTDEWKRYIIPFVQTNKPGADNYQFTVRVNDYTASSKERFQVGRPQFYQADQAMTTGHLRTLGTGEWDEEHIIMGNYHIFMNGNDLRISIGAPGSATAGALITTAT